MRVCWSCFHREINFATQMYPHNQKESVPIQFSYIFKAVLATVSRSNIFYSNPTLNCNVGLNVVIKFEGVSRFHRRISFEARLT